ncbi:transcriptional regulator, Fis family, partial [Nocardioidaceae bacterium Broad-1]
MTEPDLARRLLDAHVAHEMAAIRGVRFLDLVTGEIDFALRAASELTLDQVMPRDLIKEVALKYVSTFRLPGAIPEVAGAIATRLRAHPANDTLLGEVVSRPRIAELVEVLVEMRTLRQQVLRSLAENSGIQAGVGTLVRGTARGAVDTGRRLADNLSGGAFGFSIAERVAGRMADTVKGTPVGAAVDQSARELAERGAGALLGYLSDTAASSVTDEEVYDALLEVWDALAIRPVREIADLVDDEQLVALFVGGYQVWLDVRDSEYLQALVDTGGRLLLRTPTGSFTLDRLLRSGAWVATTLIEEALRFGPPVIERSPKPASFEQLIRRRLSSFYDSPEAQASPGVTPRVVRPLRWVPESGAVDQV